MKNGMKKLRSLLLIALCIVLIVPCVCMNASAATQKQKAMKAYKQWLSKATVCVLKRGTKVYDDYNYRTYYYTSTKSSKVRFAVAYIDNDNIPELIVYTKKDNVELFGILTYKNGKIRRLYSTQGDSLIKGYYKKTGIIMEHIFTEGSPYYERYYKKNGTKLTTILRRDDYDYKVVYKIGKKTVSQRAYTAKLKKVTQGKYRVEPKLYKNLAVNRNNKLK